MSECKHGNTAPDHIVKQWPECQAGTGRHKCAVCAYELGKQSIGGEKFSGPFEICDQGHDQAPEQLLDELPSSQAGLERHRCAYRAYQDGRKAGMAILTDDEHLPDDNAELDRIKARQDISETEKSQLIQARRGQGLFRRDVIKLHKACPLTGVADDRFLIASHIKPWSVSSDFERLDGNNGLPLSPHVDRLFDKGWFTFLPNGRLLRTKALPQGLWELWGLPATIDFQIPEDAVAYFEFHEAYIFLDNQS